MAVSEINSTMYSFFSQKSVKGFCCEIFISSNIKNKRYGVKKMEQTFMKEKKILPLVLSMSLPMVLSMLVNSLFNIVDSFFVAKLSEDAITALSLVYPVQITITAISVGFGVGLNALIAYYLGAKEQEKADKATSIGIGLSLIHGILIILVCNLAFPRYISMFTSNESVITLGIRYARIAFLFSAVITVEIAIEKVFQSVGRMKETMICMLTGFVANIILDPLLIFGIGPFAKMEIAGAAWATGIGQVLTLISYIVFYIVKPLPVRVKVKHIGWNSEIWGKLYSVGIPATLNLALSSVLLSVINGILAVYGDAYVLVFGAYYKLQSFIYLPSGGIIQGIRPLVGYNYGAGEKERVRKISQTALVMAALIMLVGTVLCLIIPNSLMTIFSKNPQTISIGSSALRIISLGFIISAVSVTICGVLEGLGKGMPSLWISLVRYIIVIIPLAFILSRIMNSATGVWIAFPVTELIAAVISVIVYKRQSGVK